MRDDVLHAFTGDIYIYISPSKFLLNFTIEFCPNSYINLSEHSVINRPASAVPDFGHFQFFYVYKYKICMKTFLQSVC